MRDRIIALAGLVQALAQVRNIAENGQADASILGTALDSVMRIDASSTEAVYGNIHAVRPGLILLRDYFNNENKDQILPKLALSIMQIERRFSGNDEMTEQVAKTLQHINLMKDEPGNTDPNTISKLGKLYADTISHLRPKVIVHGNPHYLGQANIVSEIRAVLLAALRSAVLWKQMGGSQLDFLFKRKQMLAEVQSLLGH